MYIYSLSKILQYSTLHHTELTRNVLQWYSISISNSFGISSENLNKNNNHTISTCTLLIPYIGKVSQVQDFLKKLCLLLNKFVILIFASAGWTQQSCILPYMSCLLPYHTCQEILRPTEVCSNLLIQGQLQAQKFTSWIFCSLNFGNKHAHEKHEDLHHMKNFHYRVCCFIELTSNQHLCLSSRQKSSSQHGSFKHSISTGATSIISSFVWQTAECGCPPGCRPPGQ